MKNKITKLNRPTVKYIRKRLEAAVKPLAEELGVVIDLANCTFKTNNCRSRNCSAWTRMTLARNSSIEDSHILFAVSSQRAGSIRS